MKKYNKFLAGGMTAALVAGAIVPVASADYKEGEIVKEDEVSTKSVDVPVTTSEVVDTTTTETVETPEVVDTTTTETVETPEVVDTTSNPIEPPFTDVSESDTHHDGILFAYQNGIVSGYPDGTFGASKEIKRVHAALMIARALGASPTDDYADAGFTDVPEEYAWAVNYLYQEGIINGISEDTFGSNKPTTRGQMAKILVNAFDLEDEIVSGYLDSIDIPNKVFEDTATNHFSDYIDVLTRTGITTGTSEITFSPNKNVTRGQFASFIYRTSILNNSVTEYIKALEEAEKEEEVEVIVPFEVTSAKVLNAKEIQFDFSREVESTELKGAFAIALGDKAVDSVNYSVTLSEDKKSVLVTLNDKSKLTAGKGYDITVTLDKLVEIVAEEVEGKEAVTVHTEKGIFGDEVAPSIKSVTVKGSDLEVTFDDFISGIQLIKINGVNVTVPTFTGESSKTVVLKGVADLTSGTHEIILSGVEDISGNKSSVLTEKFTVTEDLSAPKVSEVVQHDNNTIKVTFDKAVSFLATGGIKVNKNGFDLSTTVTKVNDKEYLVQVVDSGNLTLYGTNEDITAVTVIAHGFKSIKTDELGTETKTSITLIKDKVAPVGDSSKLKVLNKGTDVAPNEVFTIEYNEDINLLGSAVDFIVTDSEGVRHAVTGVSVFTDTDGNNKVLEIVVPTLQGTDGKIKAGTYTVNISENSLEDKYNNKIKFSKHVFTVKGEDSNVNLSAVATDDTITIIYDEVMNGESIIKSNYTIDGKVLPEDALVYLSADKKTVTIQLPKNFIKVSGGAVVTINDKVKTLANVGISDTSKVIYISTGLVDNTAPKLVSAVKKTNNTIELVFDENIDDTTLASNVADNDFVLKVNGVGYNYTVGTGATADDNRLIITTVDTFNFGSAVSVEITAVEGDINITDTVGNKLIKDSIITAK